MRRTSKVVTVVAMGILGTIGSGVIAATPALATEPCVSFYQAPLFEADTNGDGRNEATVWYPPVPNDFNPAACISSPTSQPVPKTLTF